MKKLLTIAILLIVEILLSINNLLLIPKDKLICIDASKAMAKAIRLNWPHMKIVMCYFHLKYNIH